MGSTSGLTLSNKNLVAGGAFSAYDLIEMGPDGKGYGKDHLQITDYASVGNAANIVAQTSIEAFNVPAMTRQPVLQGPDGSIFVIQDLGGAGNGCSINKYTSLGTAGVLLATLALSNAVAALTAGHLRLLSNNTILVTWNDPTGGSTVKFAIVDMNLTSIKATTAVEVSNSAYHDVVALAAGGFLIAWQRGSTPTQMRLAVYDNTGTATTAATTFQTWAAATTAFVRCGLLSNNNVVLVTTSGNSGATGAWTTIVDPTGAQVVAPTNSLPSAGANAKIPEVSTLAGFFAMTGVPNGTAAGLAGVFNNAGVQQGTLYSPPVGSNGNCPNAKLTNDGTRFWFLYPQTTAPSEYILAQLPVTGAALAVNTTVTSTGPAAEAVDMVVTRNLAIILMSVGVQLKYMVWKLNTIGSVIVPLQLVALANIGSAAGTTGSLYPAMINGGDFTVILCYDQQNTAGLFFLVQKVVDSAVEGVAQGTGVAGDTIALFSDLGSYAVNYMGGTVFKALDHSAVHMIGVKGTLQPNALVISQVA